MALLTSYTDVPDYIRNATANVELASLFGGNTTLVVNCLAGATSLSLATADGFGTASATQPLSVWLLDGSNTEIVQVTAIDGVGNTLTLASPGTLAAHALGVSVSSAGAQGCLADTIVRASSRVERICRQNGDGSADDTLFAVARTEIYRAPSMRAAFDPDYTLILRPYHFPVSAVTSATAQFGATQAVALSLANLVLPLGTHTVEIPYAQIQGNAPVVSYLARPFPRYKGAYITLSYTGGPVTGATLASVPEKIRQACLFLTTDLLADRQNPQGAAQVKRGDVSFEARLRGDTSGKSILQLKAEQELQEYMTPPGF